LAQFGGRAENFSLRLQNGLAAQIFAEVEVRFGIAGFDRRAFAKLLYRLV
jgi:hypothetical protein